MDLIKKPAGKKYKIQNTKKYIYNIINTHNLQ